MMMIDDALTWKKVVSVTGSQKDSRVLAIGIHLSTRIRTEYMDYRCNRYMEKI